MSDRWVNGILVDAKEWYRPTEDTVVQLPIDNQQQLPSGVFGQVHLQNNDTTDL